MTNAAGTYNVVQLDEGGARPSGTVVSMSRGDPAR